MQTVKSRIRLGGADAQADLSLRVADMLVLS